MSGMRFEGAEAALYPPDRIPPAPPRKRLAPADFIDAARVPPGIAPQEFGLWSIVEARVDTAFSQSWAFFPTVTILRCLTDGTMLKGGVVVMEDSRQELRRHLAIWLAARGRVLVSGLGLGCVVRGLLLNPAVEHIDVVEIDKKLLAVIGAEFEGNPRVAMHLGDALDFNWPDDTRWDYAWHDVWRVTSTEEDTTQSLHLKLLLHYHRRCDRQGAWMLPRNAKKLLARQLKKKLLR